MHFEGCARPRDLQRAMAFYQKACDAGHLEGCRSLGVLLERTPGVTPDPARARSLFGKACDGGNAAACGNLAVQLEGDDKDRALALYVRGCEKGEGVEASATRAIAFYGRACQAKHDVACGEEKRLRGAAPSR